MLGPYYVLTKPSKQRSLLFLFTDGNLRLREIDLLQLHSPQGIQPAGELRSLDPRLMITPTPSMG
jgi:hypothetical protein